MSVLKSLRVLARYNVLTPVALLAMAAPGTVLAAGELEIPIGISVITGVDMQAYDAGAPYDALKNLGSITNPGDYVVRSNTGLVSLRNLGSATISADDKNAIKIDGDIGTFINEGTILGATSSFWETVNVDGTIVDGKNYGRIIATGQGAALSTEGLGSFTNFASGEISGVGGGVESSGVIGFFTNLGKISSSGGIGVYFLDGAGGVTGTFSNAAGATISGESGVFIAGTTNNFSNAGSITGTDGFGARFDGLVSTFTNSGAIKGGSNGDDALGFNGGVTSFTNDTGGLIQNTLNNTSGGGDAIWINTNTVLSSFINRGKIYGGDASDNSHVDNIDNQAATINFGGSNPTKVVAFQNFGEIWGVGTGVNLQGGAASFRNEAGGSITSTKYDAVSANGQLDAFFNAGLVSGAGYNVVNLNRGVTSFENDTTGTIINSTALEVEAGKFGGSAININTDTGSGSAVSSFVNRGNIFGASNQAGKYRDTINFYRDDSGQNGATNIAHVLGNFLNSGTISGPGTAVAFNGTVTNFTNTKTIAGGGYQVLNFNSGVTTFLNDVGATITNTDGNHVNDPGNDGGGSAISINVGTTTGVATANFINRGTLTGSVNSTSTSPTILFYFDNSNDPAGHAVGTFDNSGVITGPYLGVFFVNGASTFLNSGNIISTKTDDSVGVGSSGDVMSAINSGLIQGPGGFVVFNGKNLTLTNTATGQIIGTKYEGVHAEGMGAVTNAGLISGAEDAIKFYGGGTVVNSGTLKGGTISAIRFNANGQSTDDKLTITTGSRIFGGVDFGDGTDALDFSNFIGNTVLDVTSLQTLVPGTTPYFDTRDVNGDGKIAIVDIAGLNNQTIGQSLLDMLLGSNELISGQMLDASGADAVPTQFAPTLRTPALDAVDTAVLTEMDTVQKMGTKVWGGFVGGGSAKATPIDQSAVYGGIVFGAHAQLDPTFKLGGTAGYVMTTSTRQGGTQALATQTGLLGVYGQASLGVADIDVSLLAGGSAHTSTRQVIANNTTETATGIFNSMFLAPSIGVTIPVLDNEMGELLVKTSATYVGGTTTAYTETGSSMNLAVGAQTISVFDARIGLEGRKAIDIGDGVTADIVARAGILVQGNGGSASVPVTAFGQTINVATPGTSALGVYGGVGLNAQLTDTLNLNMSVDGALRTDGLNSLAVKGTLGGSF